MVRETRVGAYFYPNEPSCPVRTERAGGIRVESEPVIARNTEPLFDGHDQPRSYCLGEKHLDDWDDSEKSAVAKHVDLAHDANLDFFIVDSYVGVRKGKKVSESDGFVNAFSELPISKLKKLQFGMMYCFKAPRADMKISPGKLEINRDFEISLETAKYIVDYSASRYWTHSNFLSVKNKPYISFFLPGTGATSEKSADFELFFEQIKTYSMKKYKVEPYVVGVVSHKSPVYDARKLEGIGVDAVTGYSNILTYPRSEPVVDYSALAGARINDWLTIIESVDVPVEPTVQVGLDVTPRCLYLDKSGKPFKPTSIDQLKPFIGLYPHSMIVTGSTAEHFGHMLQKLVKITEESKTSVEEKIVTINAWNEMSEGSCMLPRIFADGIDFSYINACKSILS